MPHCYPHYYFCRIWLNGKRLPYGKYFYRLKITVLLQIITKFGKIIYKKYDEIFNFDVNIILNNTIKIIIEANSEARYEISNYKKALSVATNIIFRCKYD